MAMGMRRLGLGLGLAVALSLAGSDGAQAERRAGAATVDLELVLTIDCSYSVNEREFRLQTGGLAKAFLDREVIEAIEASAKGAIAVSVIQWASWESQILTLPWTIVAGAAQATEVAARIAAMPRLTQEGGTSISAVIDRACDYFQANPARGDRRVIDISSDGRNNSGRDVRRARDQALARGITINGLAILSEAATLGYYFDLYVVGGEGAFVENAASYDDYVHAIRRKLLREITGNKLSRAPFGRQ